MFKSKPDFIKTFLKSQDDFIKAFLESEQGFIRLASKACCINLRATTLLNPFLLQSNDECPFLNIATNNLWTPFWIESRNDFIKTFWPAGRLKAFPDPTSTLLKSALNAKATSIITLKCVLASLCQLFNNYHHIAFGLSASWLALLCLFDKASKSGRTNHPV